MRDDTGQPRHPVDHGYSWVICLGSFGINLFVNGGMRTTGILFIEVLEMFQADKGLTALTMGLMAAGFAVFSAVGNVVGAMTSMRLACLIGAAFCCSGMIITCFAPNVIVVIISLGLLSGIGYGFMLTPSLVIVGQYFHQRRSLATGIAAAGGSVGTLLIPLFLNVTISYYGFRGAVLFYAALVLHTIPAAMLLRPTSFYDAKQPTTTKPGPGDEKTTKGETQTGSGESDQLQQKLRRPDGRVDKAVRYQLVGSRIIAVPDTMYPYIFDLDGFHKDVELASNPVPPQSNGPSTIPPEPPPRTTLGVALRTFFRKLFDPELLRSFPFIFFALGLSLGHSGYIDCCLFLPPYAVEMWDSKRIATLLIATLGSADLLGRVVGGWFADLGLIRKPLIVGFSFLVVGAATIIFTFFGNYVVAFVYVVVMGVFGGTYYALLVVVIADLFGLLKLPSAVGLSSFFMGISILPLPSVFGKVQQATGSYTVVLQICGALLLLGGVSFYVTSFMQQRRSKKNKNAEPTNVVECS